MFRTKLWSKYIPLLACIAIALVYWGCADGTSPTSADRLTEGQVVLSPNFVQIFPGPNGEPDPYLQHGSRQNNSSSEVISAQFGGSLSNGRVTLMFPPGALDQDTEITLIMDDNGLFVTDLSPSPLQFNVPVTMTFELDGTSAEGKSANTYIAWFNEAKGNWEIIDNLPPPNADKIRALVDHFSKFSGIGG